MAIYFDICVQETWLPLTLKFHQAKTNGLQRFFAVLLYRAYRQHFLPKRQFRTSTKNSVNERGELN